MKKQALTSHTSLAPEQVAALIGQQSAPLATHIEVPHGIAAPDQQNLTALFHQSLSALQLIGHAEPTEGTDNTGKREKDLTFGAPQLDLALPAGTLTPYALHEFNPKHWRDQQAAFTSALALLGRRNDQTTNAPVFCFLTEDQSQLINWLQGPAITALNMEKHNLILITAKHSDDLLWAIEETMHNQEKAHIIAHFNLLAPTAAQRLNILAKQQKATCLMICNHKTQGGAVVHSSWSIQQQTTKGDIPAITLEHNDNQSIQSWELSWQVHDHRFRAVSAKTKNTGQTIH